MDLSFPEIVKLTRFTIQNPRGAARTLIAWNVPDSVRWLLFGLVVTASAFLTHVGFNLLPAEETAFMGNAMSSPLQTAVLQAGFLLLTVVCIVKIGKWQGGTGTFADTLLLIGWLQIVLLALQTAQILALLVLPPLAETIGVVGLGLSFWLLSQFIAELHGFQSAWRVFFAILGVILAAAIGLSVVLVMAFGAGG